jgi:Flp pilus assembly protein TadG
LTTIRRHWLVWARLAGAEASSIAEFAISLPLLIVLVVGIFDFGGAFNLKQELNNATREGARFGASQPTNDLCADGCTVPASVDAIRYLVDSYLTAAGINDCGLSTPTLQPSGGPTWVYTSTGTCPTPGIVLTITRGGGPSDCVLSATFQGNAVNVPCTRVSIVYPYAWHFNSVIQLLVPGSSFALSSLTTTSTVANMN